MAHSGIAMGFLYLGSTLLKSYVSRQTSRSMCLTTFQNGLFIGFRNMSKEIAPRQTADQDLILEKLSTAIDVKSILEVVEAHHSVMNNKHVLKAMRTLFDLQKSSYWNTTNNEILHSTAFIKLCKSLKSQSRLIELNETIEALKIISYFGVPATSIISQVLLQLVRHNVNDLSLQQILFLDFLLHRMEKCPLVEALRIALPLVFETHLKIKMDPNNIYLLSEMLQYACKREASPQCLELLINTLTDSHGKMDTRAARTILWSLCDLSKPLYIEPLVQRTFKVLTETLNQCTFQEVEDLLRKLTRQIVRKRPHFYDEEFMNECALYVIQQNCTFEQASWILKRLSRIGHTNIELLDYLGKQISANPSLLEDCKPNVLITLLAGLANADYKPAEWDLMQKIILDNKFLDESKVELPWLKFAINMATLGCFSTTLLQRVFQEDFLKQYLSREYNLLDYLQLLLLYQSVVTLYPAYRGPFPPSEILEKVIIQNGDNKREFPLQQSLERGFGGANYVQTRLFTKLGHFLDHVIVLRKGGYPVAIPQHTTSERVLIEDLKIPSDSQVIIIIGFHEGCYAVNSARLRGHLSLLVKSIEALGYSVVPISIRQWTALPDNEKIPYLMQNIKYKSEEVELLNLHQNN